MTRRLVVGLVVGLVVFGGCTVAPDPDATLTPVPAPTFTPTHVVSVMPLPPLALACEPVDPNTASHFSSPDNMLKYSKMVDAGEGLNPGEHWWVIVEVNSIPSIQSTYLANYPAHEYGGKHFSIGIPGVNTDAWWRIEWTDERLAQGQAAQAKAIACTKEALLADGYQP
jgi:hypothetical protein